MRWFLAKVAAGLGIALAAALAFLAKSRRNNKDLKSKIEVKEETDEVVDRVRKAVDAPPSGGYAVDRVLAEIRARDRTGHGSGDN